MSAAERPSAALLSPKGLAAKGASSSLLRAFVTKNASPQVVACSVLLGLYVGAVFVLGHQLDSCSAVSWGLSTLCKVLAVAAVAAVVSFAAFCLVQTKGYAEKGRAAKPTAKLRILTVLVLIVPQVFVWLVVFPGVYGYDGNSFLRFYFGQLSPITTQYSVIYMVLLGVCTQLGGGATASIALAVFVQSAVSIYALYRLCLFVLKQTRSMAFFVTSLLFSALFPFGLLLRVSTAQDVLFGAFFLLVVIELVKLGGAVRSRRSIAPTQLIPLVIFSVLMMLARNNGLHAFLVMIVISAVFIIRKKAWKVAGCFAAALVLYFLISGPIYGLFGIQGSKYTVREMLSIPSQQMTRALEEHPERITEAEKLEYVDAYDNIHDYDFAPDDTTWYWSQSEISDVAKDRLDQSYVKGSLPAYLATYISLGLKCPGSYTDAFLMNTLGFWYPLKAYPDPRMYHPYVEYSTNMANVVLFNWNGELTDTEGCSLFPGLKAKFDSFMSEVGWSNIPVLSIFLKSGFVFLVFVFLSLVAFVMRRSDMLFAFAFCGGFVITLLLAPVCLFRYVYPLLISLPALALVLLSGVKADAPAGGLSGLGAEKS